MRPALALAALLFAVGCGVPLPADKNAYVGTWRAPGVELTITRGGSVKYQRGNTKLDAPIKQWEGDSFSAGIGPFATRFEVSAPPHQVGGRWLMTVDGRELVRDRR